MKKAKLKLLMVLGCMVFLFLPVISMADFEDEVPIKMFDNIQEAGRGIYGDEVVSSNPMFSTTIGKVISVVLGGMGMLLSGVVVYGAYLWLSAGGNEEQVKKGRAWIINGVAGIVLATSAYLITDYVLFKLELATGDVSAPAEEAPATGG